MHKAAIIYCTSPTELVSLPDSNQEASGCNTAENYWQFALKRIEAKESIFECKSCLISWTNLGLLFVVLRVGAANA